MKIIRTCLIAINKLFVRHTFTYNEKHFYGMEKKIMSTLKVLRKNIGLKNTPKDISIFKEN